MHCKEKFKLSSHNTSDCLIEVDTKAGLTVYGHWVRLIPWRRLSILVQFIYCYMYVLEIFCLTVSHTQEMKKTTNTGKCMNIKW